MAATRGGGGARPTLAAILNSLRDAVLVIDAETYALLDVNQAACRLSGYSRAELLRMSAGDLRVPEQRASLEETIGAAIERDGLAKPYLVSWRTKSGAILPIEFVNRRVQVGGHPVVVASGRDISDRLAWEASARAAEARFAQVLENAPLAIYLKDADGRFTHVNREYRRWLDRSPEQILGRTVDDFVSGAEAARLNQRDRAVLESGTPSTVEGTPLLPNGDGKRSIVTVRFPLHRADGAVAGVGSISSDITALRQAQERLNEFFTLSSDIFAMFGPDGRFEQVNPAIEKLLGYSAEELRALPPLALIHPDDLAAVPAAGTAFDAAEQGYHIEVRYRHKSGHYRWLDWTGAPRSADGRRYATARDITDRKRMQQEAEAHALQQAALSNLSRLALADIEIDGLLGEATRLVVEALAAHLGAVLASDPDGRLVVRAAVGFPEEMRGFPVAETSLAGYAMERQATVIAPDLANENRFPRSAALERIGAYAGMATPLHRSGGMFGVLQVFTRAARGFSLEEATFLASMASVLSSALERDRAVRALRRSEERYRGIFENAAEGIFQTDGRGGLRVVNSAAAQMLGYASGAELLASVTNVRAQLAANPVEFDALQRRLMATGTALGVDAQMYRKDGSLVDTRLNARVTTEADGTQSVSVLAADVTAERNATKALQESEERYRRIFEDASEGIFQTNGLARFTLMNRAMANILGYSSPEEAIAAITHVGDLYVDPDRREQLLDAIETGGSIKGEEVRFRRRDGTTVILALSSRVLDDGRGCRGISGVAKDVTAERAAHEALQRSEEQYRRIVESTSEGIWTIDATATTSFVNGRMAAMLGYTPEQMVGRSLREFTHADDWAKIGESLSRRRQGLAEQHEFRFLHHDGRAVWTRVSATPLLEGGEFVGSLALVRDLTELREARQYKHRALHDPLTGLPNRVLFGEHCEQALRAATRRGEPVAVLQIDLDGFKQVNDTFGHAAGDMLLQGVAERLRRAVRESDTVARLGGDEFAVLLANSDAAAAQLVAEKLVAAMRSPFRYADAPIAVGMSVGVAAFPKHGHGAALLLRRADIAMYAAKRAHGGAAIWSPRLDSGIARAS